MRTQEQIQQDYLEFRGKCKILAEEAVKNDSSLTLVRGYYFCPLWCSNEQHWWTKREDDTIYDPSARQFPSNGSGIYEEFDGIVECAQCGKEMKEEDAIFESSYVFCSNNRCFGKFVGIY